jgi:hypothetical protein|tara:strand:+ start:2261 stop:6862 length:4602 start_codon:yes stop_codon:yes gene_type:complete
MTDSDLTKQELDTVPEGSFGIGSKTTDDFTKQYKNVESSIDWNQTIDKEDSINRYYMDESPVSFVDEGSENDVNNQALKQAVGLGFEIGAGIGTDTLTAPLLVAPVPGSRPLYFAINFGSGYLSNVAAQKVRGDDFNIGEAIAAGFTQMIPFGSTGKGVKGIAGAGLQGATTAVGETTVRTAIDEQRLPTLEEFGTSAALGTALGTGFKGSAEGLEKLFTKYSGKSADEINKLITPQETKQVDEMIKQINEINTTGVDTAQGTRVDNAFSKFDEETRDRIDDALGLRRRVKPFKTNLEAGRGLKGSQGADELKKRLQLETNFKRANPDEVRSIQDFIDVIGDDMFDDVSISLSNKIGAAGQFDFANSLITIRRKVVEGFEQGTGGGLDHVAVHELWHSLSRYLPKEDLTRYKKEFTTAQSKYLKQFDKERARFIRTTSKEKLSDLIYQRSDNPYARKPTITDKNFLKKANAYFEQGKFINENYRFKNIDEFFAENLADEFFKAIETGGRLDLAPTGTFKRISQEVSIFLQDLFINLRARLGGPNTQKIFSDFVKRKNVKKYRRFALDQTSVDRIVETPKGRKTQNLGDEGITPNQVNPKQVSNSQRQFNLIAKRIAQLKDAGTFSNVKTIEDTIDGGIAMLADTNKVKNHAKMYAKIYGLVPTDELNYALAESITLATQNTADINQRLINSINVTKDPVAIQTDINDLVTSIGEIDEWLRLGLPLRTEQGRGLRSMQIPTQGVPYEEFAKMTAAEKYKLNRTGQSDISIKSSEQSLQLQDLKTNLTEAFEEAQQTGDYTKLNKLTNTIKRSEGSVEKLSALYRTGLLGRTLSQFNQGVRVFNEIGINALLSAPTTNEVNFLSGLLETYTSAFELALGAGSKTEFNAAIQHLIGLHSNFNFSLKAFNQSFKTSDNFINRGAMKADYKERFIISSDDPGFVGKGINVGGKVIRFPSQLMTATDALIQAPNLIGSIHYQGYIEGIQQGLKGEELGRFVKGHLDAIIEYYASNSGKGIKDPITARILKRSQEFAKRSTFTEDIRTDGYSGFGKTAQKINEAANEVPLVRALMAFVRTPTNILKRQLRRTPVLNNLVGELRNDLNSVDPIVRNQARGQMRLANGLGTMIVSLVAVNAFRKDDPNYYPPVILTGGGPDFTTKEGRAVYSNMRKNGWQAYSIGSLQKDKDGNAIIGEDGKPVYKYQSYERIDPLSTWIGLMVDFVNVNGFLTNDEYDEFMVGWIGAFSRNLIDRSYTRQVYEASRAIYDENRREDFFARQLAARTPYANFIRYAKRLPGDLLDMVGQEKGERFRQKRDLKVRAGDKINEEGKEIQGASELRKLLNQASETIPGYGAGLPYMREHITDEAILYPEKAGPDLFNFVRKSQSKNHPIFSALAKIAKPLREPSDVITGSATNSQIEPYKLTSNEYAELRKVVNNHIPASQKYGNNNLNDALKVYLKSSHYKENIAIVERNGVEDSPVAVDRIYDKLRDINNYYIEEGENEWIRNSGTGRIVEQTQKKRDVQQNYLKELQSFSSN